MQSMTMQLNADQDAAAQMIYHFLVAPNQKEMSVSGPPGVGKTFLLQYLQKVLMDHYKRTCDILGVPQMIRKIAWTATTNKAAQVLTAAMSEIATTIHTHLCLTVTDNYETGKSEIKKRPDFYVHTNELIICDEASMMDSKLHRILLEATDSTCKIIYVGDHCQLAPVGERLSPVFDDPSIPTVKILTPVRNVNSPGLLALCAQLRHTVETGIWKPILPVPGEVIYPSDAEMKALVDNTFAVEGADARLLAYTNQKVIDYNNYVRGLRGYSDILAPGELVVNNTPFTVGKYTMYAELELRVDTIDPTPIVVSPPSSPSLTVDAYTVNLVDPRNQRVIQVYQPVYPADLTYLKKRLSKQKAWKEYFFFKDTFPDLRGRDASTVHKSQGSTFEQSLIDLQNVGECRKNEEVARMLYVAASRARSQVYLYGRLPPRFGI